MHTASRRFWQCFEALPAEVQALARHNYALLRSAPSHLRCISSALATSTACASVCTTVHSVCRSRRGCTGSGSERMRTTTSSSAKPLHRADVHKHALRGAGQGDGCSARCETHPHPCPPREWEGVAVSPKFLTAEQSDRRRATAAALAMNRNAN